MNVFWSSGYHATSLPDLVDATQLSRSSLYAAFGDKHGLFLHALDRYIADALRRLDLELDSRKSAMRGLQDCLAGYIARTSGAPGKRGCLLVATAMELASHDPGVARRIRHFFEAMQSRLVEALARAKAEGELADGVEPPHIARLLICLFEGMRVVGKTGQEPRTSEAMVRALLDCVSK